MTSNTGLSAHEPRSARSPSGCADRSSVSPERRMPRHDRRVRDGQPGRPGQVSHGGRAHPSLGRICAGSARYARPRGEAALWRLDPRGFQHVERRRLPGHDVPLVATVGNFAIAREPSSNRETRARAAQAGRPMSSSCLTARLGSSSEASWSEARSSSGRETSRGTVAGFPRNAVLPASRYRGARPGACRR